MTYPSAMDSRALVGIALMFVGGVLMGFMLGWGGTQVWTTGIGGLVDVSLPPSDVGIEEKGQDE